MKYPRDLRELEELNLGDNTFLGSGTSVPPALGKLDKLKLLESRARRTGRSISSNQTGGNVTDMKAIGIAVIGCVANGMVAPLFASAQVAGDRIRVTVPSGEVVGVLTETRSAELVLELEGGDPETVARDGIRRLERSLGVHRMLREGAIIGAGGAWGLAFIPAFFCSNSCTEAEMAGLLSGFVLAGAGVGALAGTLRMEESWETMEGWTSPGVGERIRVTLPSGVVVVGVLAENTQGEVALALRGEGDGQRTVAQDDIRRLERSLGVHRQTSKGAEYGFLGGIAMGVANWLAVRSSYVDDDYSEPADLLFSATWIWSLLGAGAGALVGTFVKAESWETIADRPSPAMTSPRLLLNVRPGLRGETPSLLIGGQLRF